MTIRQSMNQVLARIRLEQLFAALLLFPAFIVSAYTPLGGLLVLFCVVLIVHALWRVRRQIRCTSCNQRLGHILLNANLTRNNYAVLLCPLNFPLLLKTCPACGADLDEEPEQGVRA